MGLNQAIEWMKDWTTTACLFQDDLVFSPFQNTVFYFYVGRSVLAQSSGLRFNHLNADLDCSMRRAPHEWDRKI